MGTARQRGTIPPVSMKERLPAVGAWITCLAILVVVLWWLLTEYNGTEVTVDGTTVGLLHPPALAAARG